MECKCWMQRSPKPRHSFNTLLSIRNTNTMCFRMVPLRADRWTSGFIIWQTEVLKNRMCCCVCSYKPGINSGCSFAMQCRVITVFAVLEMRHDIWHDSANHSIAATCMQHSNCGKIELKQMLTDIEVNKLAQNGAAWAQSQIITGAELRVRSSQQAIS